MKYQTILLDCDGVVLDSNEVKNEAFRAALSGFTAEQVEDFIDYHMSIGGVSRYKKFEHFLRNIVGNYSDKAYCKLVEDFGQQCRQRLGTASLTEGCARFLDHLSERNKPTIISGGDQDEIRSVFSERGLSEKFAAIYGSPNTKDEHFDNLLRVQGVDKPVLYIGDSVVDHQVADKFAVDFIFLSQYTDLAGWREYCFDNKVTHYSTLAELMKVWGW